MQEETLASAILLAKEELHRSSRVARESMVLVGSSAAEWRDSALGCPERGSVYAPVVTSGYVIKMRAGAELYSVHVGAGRAVICALTAQGGADAKLSSSDAVVGLKRAEEARVDLAKQLDVPASSIVIEWFRPATWPDARLGCPGEAPASRASVRGFLIQLSSRGKKYEFHSDATNRPRRCDS